MGLTIQRRNSTKMRATTTLIALFALVAQPMYGLIAGQVANAISPSAAPLTTQTVRTGDLNDAGWYFFNDEPGVNTITPSTVGKNEIIAGPGEAVTGAVKINSASRLNIATNQYAGTPLGDVAKIGYSSYHEQAVAGSTYIQFNVDFNYNETASGPWQSRLTYIPNAGANTWNAHEGVQGGSGEWVWSGFAGNGNKWLDGTTTAKRTWSDIVDAFPQSKIQDGALGQLLVRSEVNTSNYIDDIYVATAVNNIKYNFELDDHAAPAVKDVELLPMSNGMLVSGDVKVSFTMTDASDINFSKSLTHVRLTNGKDMSGNTVNSPVYQVYKVPNEADRYYATVKTTDFVPSGTTATGFRVYIRTEDKVGAGNQAGVAFFKNQITVDNVTPEVEILDVTQVSGGKVQFTGEVFDENFSHYYCWLTRTAGGELSGTRGDSCVTTWASDLQRNGNPATTLPTGTNGEEILGQFNITGLEDGEYVIHVGANDRAGNLTIRSRTFVVDQTAPVISAGVYDSLLKTLTFTTSDTDVKDILVSVVGSGLGNQAATRSIDGTTWTLDVSVFSSPMTYAYTVTAVDNLDNYLTTSSVAIDGIDTPRTFTVITNGGTEGFELFPQQPGLDGSEDRVISPTRLSVSGFNTVGASSFVADPAEVLGARDIKGIDTGILGASKDIAAIAPSAQGWKFFGYAWYWWLLTIAAVAAIWWWIAAARRRNQEA